jgi:hypothetical protein
VGPSNINNNAPWAASPVSLDKEFAGLDFQNCSRECLVRSPSPSGSEPSDDDDELVIIEDNPNFIPREQLFARQMNLMIFLMALMGYRLLSMNILPFEMLMSMYLPTLHLGPPLMFKCRTS